MAANAEKLGFQADAGTQGASTFLNIPGEIRNNIYAYLIDDRLRQTTVDNYDQLRKDEADILYVSTKAPPPERALCTALFRVCRQVHNEAIYFFYSHGLFAQVLFNVEDKVDLKCLVAGSGIRAYSATPTQIQQCHKHALRIDVSIGEHPNSQALIMIPHSELYRVVHTITTRMSHRGHIREVSLSVELLNDYGLAIEHLQHHLTEPLRRLHHLQKFCLSTSAVDKEYIEDLTQNVTADRFDCVEFYQLALEEKQHATNCLGLQQHGSPPYEVLNSVSEVHEQIREAYACYGRHLLAMDDKEDPPEMFRGPKVRPGYDDLLATFRRERQAFSKAIRQLLIESFLIGMLAATRDGSPFAMEAALYMARLAFGMLNLSLPGRSLFKKGSYMPVNDQSWYSDFERSKLLYRTAQAHMALRRYSIALEAITEAEVYCPGDAEI
ncbi:MAG: hypothetical protein M1820_009834, partial [Bogoriella megaspora]